MLTGIVIFVCSIELPNDHPAAHPLFQRPERAVPMVISGYYLSKADLRTIWKHANLLHHHRPGLCRHPAVQHRADVPAAEGIPAGRHAAGGLHRGYRGPRRRRHDDVLDPVRQDSETAANLVSISTLLSVLTLPIMVALAQSVFL
ncbi:MAG: hypothetical protein V8T47_04895 [Oscillospiraceae bacterium]